MKKTFSKTSSRLYAVVGLAVLPFAISGSTAVAVPQEGSSPLISVGEVMAGYSHNASDSGTELQGIPVLPAPLEANATNADSVTVYLFADGKGNTFRVPVNTTVKDFLALTKTSLTRFDTVSSDLSAKVSDKQLVSITRRTIANVVVSSKVVPYSTSAVATASSCSNLSGYAVPNAAGLVPGKDSRGQLKAGALKVVSGVQYKVLVAGKNGANTTSRTEDKIDGKLVKSSSPKEAVTTKPVNEIVSKCIIPKPSIKLEAAASASTPSPSVAGTDSGETAINELRSLPGGPGESGSTSSNQTATSGSLPTVSGTKYDWMRAAGIPESDWGYVDWIVQRESEWNPKAVNPSSGACGLVQALPCSKLGPNWSDPVTALKWQKNYVTERFGGYAGAKSWWESHGWY